MVLQHYQEEDSFTKSRLTKMKNTSSILGTPPKSKCLINSHLLAYTISTTSPQPHRLSALPFRIQIPSLIPSRVYQSEFMREMRSTETLQILTRIWQRIKTWSRRTFIGDRVFPAVSKLIRVIPKVHWTRDNIDSISCSTDCRYFYG